MARRAGYLIAALCGLVLLYLANVWPGWQIVPFLTGDTARVLGLFNVSLVIGATVNVVYAVTDPHRWKPAGEVLTAAVGLAVLVRLCQVFPFDVGDFAVPLRLLLVLAAVGTGIGLLIQLVSLVDPRRAVR